MTMVFIKSGKKNRDVDVGNTQVDTRVGRGDRMNWEIGIDICALPCVKQITSGNLLYSTGSSAWWSVVT